MLTRIDRRAQKLIEAFLTYGAFEGRQARRAMVVDRLAIGEFGLGSIGPGMP